MDQESEMQERETTKEKPTLMASFEAVIKTYKATAGIIALNSIVFILMCVSGVSFFEPTSAEIIQWGGNLRTYTVNGDYWRLVTSVFVHIGIVHLLFNMYAFLQAGMFIEKLLGPWRYMALYISTGIISSVTSVWWSGDRVSAGASGAIFGLYGFFLALLLTNLIEKEIRKPLLQSIGIFVIYNLVYGLKGGVDNSAHIGGLLSGFVLGFVFYFYIKNGKSTRVPAIYSLLLAACISISYIAINKDDSMLFEKAIDRFSIEEEKGLAVLRLLDSIPEADALNLFETKASPAWDSAQKIINTTSNYKLDLHLQGSRANLDNYTALRKKQTDLFIRYYKGDTTVIPTLNLVNEKLLTLIDKMNKPAEE